MIEEKTTSTYWNQTTITRADRERLLGHRRFTLWSTGHSASGKSTLANATEKALHERGFLTYVLDGDNVSHGLNKDLGFLPDDRTENICRIGELASLFRQSGVVNLVAFISPYRIDRQAARELANGDSKSEDAPFSRLQ